MKNVRHAKADDLRAHYDFDMDKAKPNRFAKSSQKQMVVVLEDDLAKFFRTPEEVLHALRSLMDALPSSRKKAA